MAVRRTFLRLRRNRRAEEEHRSYKKNRGEE